MLKLFPLSMIYYLYFLIVSVVLNITLTPLLTGIYRDSLQANPYDVIGIMRDNLNNMGNAGVVKFIIAVALAITLLISIYLFIDAANRVTLLSTAFDEKQKFSLKFYAVVGNIFLKRFFQIAIALIVLFFAVFLFNYALNTLTVYLAKVFTGIVPVLRYFLEIILFTIVAAVYLFIYIISLFIYYFLPAIVIVDNCKFHDAVKKMITIFKSPKAFIKYLLFTLVIFTISLFLMLIALGFVSISVAIPALYPFLLILYVFVLIYSILFSEISTQLFYKDNQLR